MSSPYSDSWVYEGIVGALPGIAVSPRIALLLQFLLFEVAVLLLALVYELPEAAVAGTIAVVVSTVGSAELIRIGDQIRDIPVPEPYRRLLFGSNIEVVLSVLAYVALITHLFVFDPGQTETSLLNGLLGPDPPLLGVYLMLLILWDVCYRIGAGWWASVAALWRTVRYDFDPQTRQSLRRADGEIALFGLAQGAFLPFLVGQPILFLVVAGHIGAVVAVTGTSIVLLSK